MRTYWFLAKTKYGRERYAQRKVEESYHTLRTFLPVFEGKKGREEIVFPGYLFVMTHGACSYLRSTFGIASVVEFGGHPAIVPHRVMRKLRADINTENETRRPRYKYAPNQSVRAVGGPFKDQVGTYLRTTPEKRISILFSFWGKEVQATLDAEHVKAAA